LAKSIFVIIVVCINHFVFLSLVGVKNKIKKTAFRQSG